MRNIPRGPLFVLYTTMLMTTASIPAIAVPLPPALEHAYAYINGHLSEFKYSESSSEGGKKDLVYTYANPYLRISRIVKIGIHCNHVHYLLNGKYIDFTLGDEIYTYIEEVLHTAEAIQYKNSSRGTDMDYGNTLEYIDTLLQGAK